MPISVVFAGTPDFAVPSLQALLDDKAFQVTAVITQPDRPVGRKQILTPPPVKTLAQLRGVPVYQPEKLNDDFKGDTSSEFRVSSLPRPDFLAVVAYGQILSQAVLDWPSVAPVNVHASLLPRWRGASPLQHAVLHGDPVSGVSVQRMVKALDAGPVYASASVPLDARETTLSLQEKLSRTGADLLVQTLKDLPAPLEQNETVVTLCGILTREHGKVNAHTMTAEDIDRHVRALNPWPGVTLGDVKILETSLEATSDSAPLECAKGTVLHLVRVQKPGGKAVTGKEYWSTRG